MTIHDQRQRDDGAVAQLHQPLAHRHGGFGLGEIAADGRLPCTQSAARQTDIGLGAVVDLEDVGLGKILVGTGTEARLRNPAIGLHQRHHGAIVATDLSREPAGFGQQFVAAVDVEHRGVHRRLQPQDPRQLDDLGLMPQALADVAGDRDQIRSTPTLDVRAADLHRHDDAVLAAMPAVDHEAARFSREPDTFLPTALARGHGDR